MGPEHAGVEGEGEPRPPKSSSWESVAREFSAASIMPKGWANAVIPQIPHIDPYEIEDIEAFKIPTPPGYKTNKLLKRMIDAGVENERQAIAQRRSDLRSRRINSTASIIAAVTGVVALIITLATRG